MKTKNPFYRKWWYYILTGFFILGGIGNFGKDVGAAIFGILVGGGMLAVSFLIPQFKKRTGKTAASSAVYAGPVAIEPAPVSHESEMADFNAELESIERVTISRTSPTCRRRNPDTMPGIHITNITRSTNMQKLFPLVILDTETTGFGAAKNEIVELSAIKLGHGYEILSCFSTLVKPRRSIPPKATAVHHITDEMVTNAPAFPEIASAFSDYIAECNIVGHNLKFDLEFLYASGFDLPADARYYDTLDLAKKTLVHNGQKDYDHHAGRYVEVEDYDVENYKLTTLCEHYGIYRDNAHRSLSDCLATAKVLKYLVEDKLA